MSLTKIIRTNDDHMLALLRMVLGVVFFAHGAQKVLGWFGGHGFDQTLGFFMHGLGIPAVFAVVAIMAEFVGGIGLIVGLLSRVAAFAIAVDMIVAVLLVHGRYGFFMNWAGNQAGEGFEYHILVISMALLVVVRGAGAWSLDRMLEYRSSRSRGLHIRMQPEPSH
jgi:putative oxidoreductase